MGIYMNISRFENFAKEHHFRISYERVLGSEYLHIILKHDTDNLFVGIKFHDTNLKLSIFENNQLVNKEISISSQEELFRKIKMYLNTSRKNNKVVH